MSFSPSSSRDTAAPPCFSSKLLRWQVFQQFPEICDETMPDDNAAAVATVKFKPPPFDKDNPDMSISVLELLFTKYGVDDEVDKFVSLAASFSSYKNLDETSSNIIRRPPADTPYTALRTALLDAVKPADYNARRTLMEKEKWNGSLPSSWRA
jgi:hypothetical protein